MYKFPAESKTPAKESPPKPGYSISQVELILIPMPIPFEDRKPITKLPCLSKPNIFAPPAKAQGMSGIEIPVYRPPTLTGRKQSGWTRALRPGIHSRARRRCNRLTPASGHPSPKIGEGKESEGPLHPSPCGRGDGDEV